VELEQSPRNKPFAVADTGTAVKPSGTGEETVEPQQELFITPPEA
jgi:hypothetical protein